MITFICYLTEYDTSHIIVSSQTKSSQIVSQLAINISINKHNSIQQQLQALNLCHILLKFVLSFNWENMPHGHSHGHGHGCSHEATDEDHALEMGIQYSLYKKIDIENTECLNEEKEGSGKLVFKPYEDRFDLSKVCKKT